MNKILRRLSLLIRRPRYVSSYLWHTVLHRLGTKNPQYLFVDPNRIEYTVSREDVTLTGASHHHIGTVAGGDWDLNGYCVKEYGGVYSILKSRVEDGLPYEQIPQWVHNVLGIRNGETPENCTTEDDYKARWLHTEQLYRQIERDGYRAQRELTDGRWTNEIRVQIGRRGDLLFEDGIHRLVIAQLLHLETIPVLITRRHAEWESLRQSVISIILKRGFIHQPFNHPDLDILPQLYSKSHLKDSAMYGDDRWEFIINSLPVKSGTVLDIGAYFGYFDHKFENIGFECFAVEPNEANLAVLKQYRTMMMKDFTVWEKSVFEIDHFEFDVVLALNIFHHLVKKQEDYERLIAFLRRLRCKAMYFEPHKNTEVDSYKSFSDEEFLDFVIGNSVLNQARLLGRSKEGRNVYLLTE